MQRDLLIAPDNCYSQGFKVQSMQPLTWILSTPLLTSADESCPNTAPWSLLQRHCLTCQLERMVVANSLPAQAQNLANRSAVAALVSRRRSPSHCALGIDFFRNYSVFDSSKKLPFLMLVFLIEYNSQQSHDQRL